MKFIAAVLAIATVSNAISLQAQSDDDVEALKHLIPDILAKREAVDEALAGVLDRIQNICGCDPDDESCVAACNSDRCGVPGRPCEAIKDLEDLADFDDGVTAVKDLDRVEDKDDDDDTVAIKDLEDLADFDDGVVAVKDLPRVEDKDDDDDVIAIKDLPDADEEDDDIIVIADLQRLKH